MSLQKRSQRQVILRMDPITDESHYELTRCVLNLCVVFIPLCLVLDIEITLAFDAALSGFSSFESADLGHIWPDSCVLKHTLIFFLLAYHRKGYLDATT